jgi:hypothetical protein
MYYVLNGEVPNEHILSVFVFVFSYDSVTCAEFMPIN